MNVKISKTNSNLDFLYARLDEIQMSGHERLKAKAHLARAEAIADLFIAIGDGFSRLLKALVLRPLRRLTTSDAVHRLNPRHRADIARHLLRLPEEDRRLRFGHQIRDQAVREYVDRIDFARDRVFGIHGAELDLAGVAHLALDPAQQIAELGVSVDPLSRGKGHGFALLQRVVLHAANLGYRVLFMYRLAENGIMMHLAQKTGLTVVIESGEADARLKLDRRAHGGAL